MELSAALALWLRFGFQEDEATGPWMAETDPWAPPLLQPAVACTVLEGQREAMPPRLAFFLQAAVNPAQKGSSVRVSLRCPTQNFPFPLGLLLKMQLKQLIHSWPRTFFGGEGRGLLGHN